MRHLLFHANAQLRPGWKAALFLLAGVACFVLVGLIGRWLPPALKTYAPNAVWITGLGLLISWAAVRLEGRRLPAIGLQLNGRFLCHVGLGLLAGALLVGSSAALVCALAGVELVPVQPAAVAVLLRLAFTVLAGALFEELLFRGYAFQHAVRGMGQWPAIALFALLFSLAHLPGNLDIGNAMLATALAGLVLDCVIQSLLMLRTGSLALPIGLHVAWNLGQEALGFGVSGGTAGLGWFRPELGGQPGWLTGGAYGLEASAWALLVQGVVLLGLAWTARPPRLRGLAAPGRVV